MTIPYPGHTAALATALCWTLSILTFGAAARRVGSLPMNLIRLCLAWVFLAAWGLAQRGAAWPSDAPAETWLWLTLSGVVGFFLGDLFLFKAVVLIGPRLSSLLMTLAPPITALVGLFALGERLGFLGWVGMAVTVAGVAWVVKERPAIRGAGSSSPPARSVAGVVLGVLAASGQAFGLTFAKLGMVGDYDPFAATQIRALAGIGGFVVLVTILRRWSSVRGAFGERPAMVLVTAGAFFGPFLGVALLLLSVRYVPTGVAQTLASLFPVFILPFVVVIHRERVSLRALVGAVVAVGGVALLFIGDGSG